jgi:hypothetical protein
VRFERSPRRLLTAAVQLCAPEPEGREADLQRAQDDAEQGEPALNGVENAAVSGGSTG